jgi:ribosomal protein S18 acetylase RimI-like enzyme
MPNLPILIRLGDSDVANAAKALARSFLHDPMMLYIFPDEPQLEKKLFLLFQVMVRYGLRYGEVYAPSSNIEGVAIWLSSDNMDMSLAKMEKCGLSEFSSQVSPEVMTKLIYLNDFASARNKIHAPFKHWYLAFIGVDTDYHGKGFASSLIKPMLQRLDGEKLSCYLETATEKNVAIYEHFGFKLIEKMLVPGTEVEFWAMMRGTH